MKQMNVTGRQNKKKMAARILEDVLNNFISIDSLLEWLSTHAAVDDVNNVINHYSCNQVDFVSYFLNFLREQSSSILQSSCSVETPCKDSQLRKAKTINYSTDKSATEDVKYERSINSTGNKLDIKSFDSFPALGETSNKSRSYEKNCDKFSDSTQKDSPSSTTSKKFRRLELFPGRKDSSPNHQETNSFCNSFENYNQAIISTPKSTGKDSVDISDYFSDVVNLDVSSDWSPGFNKKRDSVKTDNSLSADKSKQNCNGIYSNIKSRSFGGESTPNRGRDSKCSKMMLSDFMLNDENKKEKKNKARKRINPTRVTASPAQFEGNSTFKNSSSLVENESSVADERELLKIECANVLEQLEGKSVSDGVKDYVPGRVFSTPSKKAIIANLESATCVDELKTMARIYSYIIDENYCQNIMIELCYTISLLVIQDHTSLELGNNALIKKGKRKYLNSIHNCVYFAVETLALQKNVLILLNLAALKLLSENKEIKKFSPDLNSFLTKAYVERQGRDTMKRLTCDSKWMRQGNVSFECETDNKDNFTNLLSFHSFRKQRDLFYNILENWEENHLTSGWEFSANLDSKIKSLLSICPDPTNLLHLARLFRCQLVMSCCGDYRGEDESDEEILQLLASVDPNKILRLRARLRSTPKRQGPCPLPDFMGNQEFFKDFILSTSHTSFHYYLKNSLCDEILRLNEAEFSSDLEDDESCLDQQTQSRYLQEINILCLLAKFLGFLEFLPYRSDKQWSDRVLTVHCAARQNLLPLFDLETCLKTAFTRHKLTVTVPWMTSFLSMIDTCSARLNPYQKVWKILINIYRQLKSCKNLMNSFYLKLVLGWIFQLPNFPTDLFYSAIEDMNRGCSLDLCIEFSVGLDSYNFIEENILYSVCPYLSEINSILTENSGCGVRHIRPITQGNSSGSIQVAKHLELRLEESFLHSQSSSTRKTIEFVTERVSSAAVKYLINDVIPKVKEKALNKMNELLSDSEDLETEVDAISEKCYADLIKECEIECWRLSIARSEKAMNALLSLDVDAAVSKTCIQIAIRQSAEKVKRWMETHVTLAVIKKEFSTIVLKRNKKQGAVSDPSMGNFSLSSVRNIGEKGAVNAHVFDVDKCSVSYVFITLREIMWNVYEGEKVVWDDINKVLQTATKVVENSREIFPAMEKTLLAFLLDLIIIICVRYETEFKKENFSHLFNLMKKLNEVKNRGNALERIICPRNLALLLREAKNRERSWQNLGNIFLFLRDEGFLNQDKIETQLVSLLIRNWGKTESELFIKLFNHILKKYTDKNGCDKFTLLLEFLIETVACDGDESMMD